MPTSATLLTVEEFQKVPESTGNRRELHHGEMFELTAPKLRHWKLQKKLADRLESALKPHGFVGGMEFAFRPAAEYEFWVADVAFLTSMRFSSIDPDSNLSGSPDLVIEVESPSNTAQEFAERQDICLRTGCREFWVVFPTLQLITVTTEAGTHPHKKQDSIRLSVAPVSVPVREIFE